MWIKAKISLATMNVSLFMTNNKKKCSRIFTTKKTMCNTIYVTLFHFAILTTTATTKTRRRKIYVSPRKKGIQFAESLQNNHFKGMYL